MVTKAALRHLNRCVIRRIGRYVFVLAAWYLIESFQTKAGAKSRRRAPSASVRPSVASSDPCITERSHTQRDTNTRARVSGEHAPSLRFVTFAFTRNAGDRWGVTTTRRVLKLMYSSKSSPRSNLSRVPESLFRADQVTHTLMVSSPSSKRGERL